METTASNSSVAADDCPLYVDLDGTLIAGDTLWESLMVLAGKAPVALLLTPLWALGGKANLKEQLSLRALPAAAYLPYRAEVLKFLRQQKTSGRRIVLATAAHRRIAQAVANHLGIFDDILASDAKCNLHGSDKLAAIAQNSAGPFDYAGDSAVDLPVFQACRQAYIVGAGLGLRHQVAALAPARPPVVLDSPTPRIGALLHAMRPKHWIKNLLLFVPLLFAHKLGNASALRAVSWAFVAMSLTASSVYVLNDLLDLEADRAHPHKRNRPFASGALSIPAGLIFCILLMCGGLGLAWWRVGWQFTAALGGYLAATMAYSLVFKRKLLLDVIALAGLYTARILAGGVAANVKVSSWLAAFSMFMFISLAFVKRYSELTLVKKAEQTHAKGRNYMVDDLEILLSTGPASGYMAVLVFCLYISSPDVQRLYRQPDILWCICPLLIYWITRVWFLAKRQDLEDDPVLFAIGDWVSWLCGLAALVVMLAAGPI